jgi:hypothetical protein
MTWIGLETPNSPVSVRTTRWIVRLPTVHFDTGTFETGLLVEVPEEGGDRLVLVEGARGIEDRCDVHDRWVWSHREARQNVTTTIDWSRKGEVVQLRGCPGKCVGCVGDSVLVVVGVVVLGPVVADPDLWVDGVGGVPAVADAVVGCGVVEVVEVVDVAAIGRGIDAVVGFDVVEADDVVVAVKVQVSAFEVVVLDVAVVEVEVDGVAASSDADVHA